MTTDPDPDPISKKKAEACARMHTTQLVPGPRTGQTRDGEYLLWQRHLDKYHADGSPCPDQGRRERHMSESKHTQGPLKVDLRGGCLAVYPANEDHNCLDGITELFVHYKHGTNVPGKGWEVDPLHIADAERIVHCWNCHDELLEALKDAVSGLAYIKMRYGELDGVGWERVEVSSSAAIAAATGEAQ